MINIDEINTQPDRETWAEFFKDIATVNLLKALCVNCKEPIKFKAYKIFIINKKKKYGGSYYYIIVSDSKGQPQVANGKYVAVRLAENFPVFDQEHNRIGTVESEIKRLEKSLFYITATTSRNNILRWAVVVLNGDEAGI